MPDRACPSPCEWRPPSIPPVILCCALDFIRSFPRKRESRANYAGPGILPWVPACAGTSGIEVEAVRPHHALLHRLDALDHLGELRAIFVPHRLHGVLERLLVGE